ncbi:activating signal cointegrator 1 [Toxorhynchites rutilus septentrionalis]|uniref:activating signal cointegrator 1 n=1 Tax=Toxorhynchites rutilus septentrionalis TaxID=329112 RepID=UPI00247A1C01|nr:activating signal cointegrator 1 [Toxorhynchites rutilus septentrionalis]
MDTWLKERLSKYLGFVVPDEMISYILTIRSSQELEEYFETLLNLKTVEHGLFLDELKQRLRRSRSAGQGGRAPKLSKAQQQQENKKAQQDQQSQRQPPEPVAAPSSSSLGQGAVKKKTKFVNLYDQKGQTNVVLFKGRHLCDCQATKHKLVNNCLQCGRIVCAQEGSGPCLFCGSLVCTEEEQRTIDSSSRKGDNLKRTLMDLNRPKGWEEAVATRNRLLEYDRNSEKRTTVIDDESDYFKANSVWLSDAERKKMEKLEAEMREKKHASRLTRKVTLDFAGRQVVEEPELAFEVEDNILKQIVESVASESAGTGGNQGRWNKNPKGELSDDIHPGIVGQAPVFIESCSSRPFAKHKSAPSHDGVYSKVQDKEFLEMSDLRHCISMHQPWASLLVAGIKQHEGRTWYSSHRGRLWIASTVRPVDMEMVKQMENFYRVLYHDESIEFPSQYPSGCLLGCVSVQDVLPQEEYRKQYPEGESESPFVFVCTDPQELPIRFPVKGQHKIYNLDTKIHQAAVKSLQRLSKLKAEE